MDSRRTSSDHVSGGEGRVDDVERRARGCHRCKIQDIRIKARPLI
jgi:hypothetical protein